MLNSFRRKSYLGEKPSATKGREAELGHSEHLVIEIGSASLQNSGAGCIQNGRRQPRRKWSKSFISTTLLIANQVTMTIAMATMNPTPMKRRV